MLLSRQGEREVSYLTARQFGDNRGIPVVEVCGKEGVHVELAFMALVGEIHPFCSMVSVIITFIIHFVCINIILCLLVGGRKSIQFTVATGLISGPFYSIRIIN